MSLLSQPELRAALRGFFESSGYRRYKMSKFEEYDLYAGNKNFLMSEKVLTFTDTDGKLLALKPDVTLSIIKNFRQTEGVEKLYYHESVYRDGGHGFREIEQAGVECLGDVDEYAVCEVLSMAAQTLGLIGPRYELDISHLGILSEALSPLDDPEKARVIELFGGKNFGEIENILEQNGVSEDVKARILQLSRLDCPAAEAPKQLQDILGGYVSWERLQLFCDTCEILGRKFGSKVRVDFSTVGDISYYSGIIFRGYLSGVPQSVLSGGQYDQLMTKLQKRGRAIGFAMYLDLLEPLIISSGEFDFDALLVYPEEAKPADILSAAEKLRSRGLKVSVMPYEPADMRFGEIYRLGKDGDLIG